MVRIPRFLLSRRWIAIHLLAAAIVVVCLLLAFWQLGRLERRQASNARLAQQAEMEQAPLGSLLPSPAAGPSAQERAEYRLVAAAGRYDISEQVVLQSRGLDGRPGNHLLTPLVLDSGSALLVDRGWVPLPTDEQVLAESAPPSGSVAVRGKLLRSEEKGPLGVADPPPGRVTALPRIDLDRIAEQLPYPLYPLYLRLESQEPPNAGALPEIAPIPEPDDGPHREYALQWFLFAGMAAIIYAGLVRREGKRHLGTGDPLAALADPPPDSG